MEKMTPKQEIIFRKACLQIQENNPKRLWLDLRFLNIADPEAIKLADLLSKNTALKTLELSYNQIGPVGLEALAQSLKNTSLKKINFAFNHLGDRGAKALAQVLNETQLAECCLADNQIGDQGVVLLSEALKVNSTLTKLDLSCE